MYTTIAYCYRLLPCVLFHVLGTLTNMAQNVTGVHDAQMI